MKRLVPVLLVAAVAIVGLSVAVGRGVLSSPTGPSADPRADSPEPSAVEADAAPGQGLTALAEAARAGKYLFVFFFKDEGPQTRSMRAVFDQASEKAADRAMAVAVRTTDPAEKGIVARFELDRAPMPLVLAIAPNGAIMGGFPTRFEEKDLLGAFGTPSCERCMKAMQESKLVLLCVQNARTSANEAAMQGVRDFKADPRFGHATEIVTLDPSDAAEASFLADLKIDPKTPDAMTAFLVPPGSVVAEFKGATTKDELIAALEKANTGCGPGGCGPNGCGPKK